MLFSQVRIKSTGESPGVRIQLDLFVRHLEQPRLGIVRTRREIRQKTKALTGEARITTKILAAIPIVIMLSMYGLNREYLLVLFQTAPGQKLLTFGAISIVIGLIVIGKMSKLDTSR